MPALHGTYQLLRWHKTPGEHADTGHTGLLFYVGDRVSVHLHHASGRRFSYAGTFAYDAAAGVATHTIAVGSPAGAGARADAPGGMFDVEVRKVRFVGDDLLELRYERDGVDNTLEWKRL